LRDFNVRDFFKGTYPWNKTTPACSAFKRIYMWWAWRKPTCVETCCCNKHQNLVVLTVTIYIVIIRSHNVMCTLKVNLKFVAGVSKFRRQITRANKFLRWRRLIAGAEYGDFFKLPFGRLEFW